ncbi:MAG: 1-deoxy-D-xylulose-5-phosphate reductoisomerase [Mycobacteriales bacterium]
MDGVTRPRDIVLLGCTGSIGTQTADVVRGAPDRFRIVALAAAVSRPDELARQAVEFDVAAVAVSDPAAVAHTRDALSAAGSQAEVRGGLEAVTDLATYPADVVLNAITGSIGLAPTLAALDAGRTVALANKESLVAGGALVKDRARPGQIVPVDSEHSALAQCLRSGTPDEVARLVLTASGGPFRGRGRAGLGDVTVQDALAHPTWDMGPVVTINSATLVNKGLEVIEAHELFDIPYDAIDVVIHPQSLVHSMVTYADGSTIAQLSPPDMRLAIAVAIGWPRRVPGAGRRLDWSTTHELAFSPFDDVAFPAVRLARSAGQSGGVVPAIFNAANEELVAAFIRGRVPFLAIVDTLERVLDGAPDFGNPRDVADVWEAEEWARGRARDLIDQVPVSGSMSGSTGR